jgi:hypothetical protein
VPCFSSMSCDSRDGPDDSGGLLEGDLHPGSRRGHRTRARMWRLSHGTTPHSRGVVRDRSGRHP